MSLAISENQILRTKMKWALPWLGMGLCLAILATHLAFDFVGRSRASGADPDWSRRTAERGDRTSRSKFPNPESGDHGYAQRVEAQGRQDHDRAGAFRPVADRARGSRPY